MLRVLQNGRRWKLRSQKRVAQHRTQNPHTGQPGEKEGLKSLLFAIDSLWLYNFHQQEFDGTTRTVLETISFFEEKKWQIVRLEEIKEDLETSVERLADYNPNSNPTYLKKERKSNLFIASTMDYFVLFVPATLLFVFLCNRCFHLLFNCRISIFLRAYSFWWVLLELLLQNNVEFFSFLCFRNTLLPSVWTWKPRCSRHS